MAALSNNDGNLAESYRYTPFGSVTFFDIAHQPTGASAVKNPYLFTARRYDGETGLYDYRARMYNPQLGRFMQPDPIGYYDAMNLYQYCGNNPVNWTDPWGLAMGRDPLNAEDSLLQTPELLGKEAAKSAKQCPKGWWQKLKELFKRNAKETFKQGKKLTKEQEKSIRSYEKRIAEHRKKLDDYLKNPEKYDHKELLKNATPEQRQRIIQGRKNHLEKGIKTYEDNIRKIRESGT